MLTQRMDGCREWERNSSPAAERRICILQRADANLGSIKRKMRQCAERASEDQQGMKKSSRQPSDVFPTYSQLFLISIPLSRWSKWRERYSLSGRAMLILALLFYGVKELSLVCVRALAHNENTVVNEDKHYFLIILSTSELNGKGAKCV